MQWRQVLTVLKDEFLATLFSFSKLKSGTSLMHPETNWEPMG